MQPYVMTVYRNQPKERVSRGNQPKDGQQTVEDCDATGKRDSAGHGARAKDPPQTDRQVNDVVKDVDLENGPYQLEPGATSRPEFCAGAVFEAG